MSRFGLILLAVLVSGCYPLTRLPPEPGEIYAIYPDPWCKSLRVRVLSVGGGFVKYEHVGGSGGQYVAPKMRFEDRLVKVFERDPYNCTPPK